MARRERGAPREPGICRLNRVPISECGEELVDIRQFCRGIRVKANPSLLRRSAAEMLQRAQDSLPEGYFLQAHTCLRTYEMQSNGYFKHLESLRENHPEWPLSVLRREANRFWHPPDSKAPPGHCTGGAVDVTLVNAEGGAYDIKSTRREGIDANPTYVLGLTPEAQANRRILIDAMSGAGFSNCADEFWHWSYGDNGWAARLGMAEALFDAITVSPEVIAAATVEPPKESTPENERDQAEA
ncbi:MAG TPA: M15 family metallopeptidase [Armatimonadota bacterium]|nr:M15 family metallopeptidase [Armatimonadota bacterium]